MTFGEKLQRCRKEAGLSQEELAEQLNVSRQAVSKWERDSGYPETEKLIRMSKLFHVTLDYLLLDEVQEDTGGAEAGPEAQVPPDQGLYVSRELAESYLLHQRRRLCKLGGGWGLLVGSMSLSFWQLSSVLDTVVMLLGVLLLVSAKLDGDPYRKLRQQPLVFDAAVRQGFTDAWVQAKSRTHGLALLGIVLVAAGFLIIPLLDLHPGVVENSFFGVGLILAGVGTFLCVYMFGIFRAYRALFEF